VTARNRSFLAPKVPEVFVVFWLIKLLTTGIGETASDFLGTWNLAAAGIIGVGGFVAALRWQTRADSYHAVRYWVTVLMVAVFGTMIADGPHVALGSRTTSTRSSTWPSCAPCSCGGNARKAPCRCTRS
jgi:uncharacterized membrane-anchored protein